jgi:hypothetical protein
MGRCPAGLCAASGMPSAPHIRTSSAKEAAAILRMICPRWFCSVISVMPNIAADCLLRYPATTSGSTSRSRGLRSEYRFRSSASSA